MRVLLLTTALALAGAAEAAAQVRWGGQVSWGDDTDIGIGARLEHPARFLFKKAPVFGAGHFDWYFPGNDVTYFELNYNLYYTFKADALAPYAGGGLRLGYASVDTPAGGNSDTEFGLNLGGGLKFKTKGKMSPFVEARFTLGGEPEQLVLTGGVIF